MTDRTDAVRVAITEIPDIHLLPGWDRQLRGAARRCSRSLRVRPWLWPTFTQWAA